MPKIGVVVSVNVVLVFKTANSKPPTVGSAAAPVHTARFPILPFRAEFKSPHSASQYEPGLVITLVPPVILPFVPVTCSAQWRTRSLFVAKSLGLAK